MFARARAPMEVGFPAAKAREDDNASLLGAAALCSDASEDGPPAALPATGATPADPYHLTYWAFVLQGVGMLFPWSVFITAAAYYRLKFKGLPQEDTFEVVFGFVYTISNLLALLLIMAYGGSSFSALTGVILPNAFTAFLFAVSGFLVFAATLDGSVLYAITLFSVFCCGVFAACLQAGIFWPEQPAPGKVRPGNRQRASDIWSRGLSAVTDFSFHGRLATPESRHLKKFSRRASPTFSARPWSCVRLSLHSCGSCADRRWCWLPSARSRCVPQYSLHLPLSVSRKRNIWFRKFGATA